MERCLQEAALQGDPVDRQSLEQLRPETFSSILILADDSEHLELWRENGHSIADADSRCLASLLLLRDIQSSRVHYGNARQSGQCLLVRSLAISRGGLVANRALFAVLVPMTMTQTGQRSWFDTGSKPVENACWSDSLMGAVQRTVIISEILDSRTRHLIQVAMRLTRPLTAAAVILLRIHRCSTASRKMVSFGVVLTAALGGRGCE